MSWTGLLSKAPSGSVLVCQRMPPMEADLAQLPASQSLPKPMPGCDFFCLRFKAWYSSEDCAFRTKFNTYGGCTRCDQGRFNLRRHRGALHGRRWLPVVGPGEE